MLAARNLPDLGPTDERIHANGTFGDIELVDCFTILLVLDDWDELGVALEKG